MKEVIARYLLEIGAVTLRPEKPFTWTSGIKSPIYCDNRLILSYPDVRDRIEREMARIIQIEYPECEMLMGTATAGISHAAIVANDLRLPMGYVRSSTKEHGRKNQIEGRIFEGIKIVVIEDLISTGKSVANVIVALNEEGCNVLGVVSIFDYSIPQSIELLKHYGCKNTSLTSYDTLIKEALKMTLIEEKSLKKLEKWKKNPFASNWSAEL